MKYRLFILLGLWLPVIVFSQNNDLPLYKKEPIIPPLRLLLADSVTNFTEKNLKKNIPVYIILFSPECEHCQKQTEEIIDSIDRLKNIQIVMATTLPFNKMKEFYNQYQLKRFSNITVGWDRYLLLPTIYRIKNFPFLALYDKKGKLITGIDGALPLSKVLEYFKE